MTEAILLCAIAALLAALLCYVKSRIALHKAQETKARVETFAAITELMESGRMDIGGLLAVAGKDREIIRLFTEKPKVAGGYQPECPARGKPVPPKGGSGEVVLKKERNND